MYIGIHIYIYIDIDLFIYLFAHFISLCEHMSRTRQKTNTLAVKMIVVRYITWTVRTPYGYACFASKPGAPSKGNPPGPQACLEMPPKAYKRHAILHCATD